METDQPLPSFSLDTHIDRIFQELLVNGNQTQHEYQYTKRRKISTGGSFDRMDIKDQETTGYERGSPVTMVTSNEYQYVGISNSDNINNFVPHYETSFPVCENRVQDNNISFISNSLNRPEKENFVKKHRNSDDESQNFKQKMPNMSESEVVICENGDSRQSINCMKTKDEENHGNTLCRNDKHLIELKTSQMSSSCERNIDNSVTSNSTCVQKYEFPHIDGLFNEVINGVHLNNFNKLKRRKTKSLKIMSENNDGTDILDMSCQSSTENKSCAENDSSSCETTNLVNERLNNEIGEKCTNSESNQQTHTLLNKNTNCGCVHVDKSNKTMPENEIMPNKDVFTSEVHENLQTDPSMDNTINSGTVNQTASREVNCADRLEKEEEYHHVIDATKDGDVNSFQNTVTLEETSTSKQKDCVNLSKEKMKRKMQSGQRCNAKVTKDTKPKQRMTRTKSSSWNIKYPEPSHDGLWRSQRTRVPPLEWHKNERIIYDHGIVSGITLSSEARIKQMEEEKAMLKAKEKEMKLKKEETVLHIQEKLEHESKECHKKGKEKEEKNLTSSEDKITLNRDKKIVNKVIEISRKYLSGKCKHNNQTEFDGGIKQGGKQKQGYSTMKHKHKMSDKCKKKLSDKNTNSVNSESKLQKRNSCSKCKGKRTSISKGQSSNYCKVCKNETGVIKNRNGETVHVLRDGKNLRNQSSEHCNKFKRRTFVAPSKHKPSGSAHCKHREKHAQKTRHVHQKSSTITQSTQIVAQETILKSHEENVNSNEVDPFKKLTSFEDKHQIEAHDLELLMPRSDSVKWSNGRRLFVAASVTDSESQITHPGGIWKSIIQEHNV